ncbi:FAD-binding domain-containing protein [Lojkania enalia]|uniref:FAD-binding domain-containing protein n=1 Tax=Lojkania enalia TaxID=147567 RepID=A0A9P4NAA6_9PLEO|nr:FAD-binding domain-containing protein [Didymosphaeria enalia]
MSQLHTLAFTFFCAFALAASNLSTKCKCAPGDSCWPSFSDFSALNRTLGGRLIQALPPASVCYQDQPNYNATACDIVTTSWFNSKFHANDPISVGWPCWANNPCPPIFSNGTSVTGDPEAGGTGCRIGAYPVYAVNATEEQHIVAAVKFAKKWRIRLNVKSTGHSFLGRSTAFGSLSVWTHHMRGIEFHESFQPKSCMVNRTQAAVTIAAGETDRDVYAAAAEHDAIVVGGSNQDVGIVGWFTGGGHGPLSSTYGLGVDNVLSARIVTPDGSLRTVNPCFNSDLFWAIRGGGGGTFGVITSVTMRAHPTPKASRHELLLSSLNASDESSFWNIVADVMSEFPRLKKGGMQGYAIILPPASIPSWTMTWAFQVYDKPTGYIQTLIEPLLEKLNRINGTSILYTSSVQDYSNYFAMWDSNIGNEPVASAGLAMGSRLIPPEALTADPHRLARILQNVTAPIQGSPALLYANMVSNDNHNILNEVSTTPAWRDATLHLIVLEGFNDSYALSEAQPVFNRLTYERVALLKSLAPESGAYFNEADAFDPNWQYDFWGHNYPRLRQIKERYDPDSVLWCLSCVGSEEWAEDENGRLCRVPWATG